MAATRAPVNRPLTSHKKVATHLQRAKARIKEAMSGPIVGRDRPKSLVMRAQH